MAMMILMMTTLTTICWTMLSFNNPMNLKLVITSMKIMLSVMISINMSSWYALILFLIYVLGMMVMFSYFTSLSSKDLMMLKSSLHFMILPIVLMKMEKTQMMALKYSKSQMSTMYESKSMMTLLIITLILLIMMIIVIKMVKKNNGPLYGFNQYNWTI